MPLRRFLPCVALAALALAASACGSEIGDSCFVSSDCSPNGDRLCEMSFDSEGYCTVLGCDENTCPDEAVCVRFFTNTFANKPCFPNTEDTGTDDCAPDELCAADESATCDNASPVIMGHCAPRAAEIRYCMRACSDASDCRDNYECRDLDLMIAHGGEPVLKPGEALTCDPPRFCAIKE